MSATGTREAEFFGFTEASAVEELLERARVVGVLDAWSAQSKYCRSVEVTSPLTSYAAYCVLMTGTASRKKSKTYRGETADAARAAAAEAIEAGEV